MHGLVDIWHHLMNPEALIRWGGYFVLIAVIFAETGLLVGFFLPGDSLLVSAGLLASQGLLNVYLMGLVLSVAAIAGDSVGYAVGKATGPRIFTRDDSLFFNRKHLHRARAFYEKYGAKTIVLARFMPIIRTFAPVVAGVGSMRYRTFVTYNIFGGLLWVWSMLFVGYALGRYIPGIEDRIDLVIVAVIILSILPGIIGGMRARAESVAPPDSGTP